LHFWLHCLGVGQLHDPALGPAADLQPEHRAARRVSASLPDLGSKRAAGSSPCVRGGGWHCRCRRRVG
jgi:hypothetical protein